VAAKATATDEELFFQNVEDVFFAYDKSDLAAKEESAVQQEPGSLLPIPT
jgi:hypothetical protein